MKANELREHAKALRKVASELKGSSVDLTPQGVVLDSREVLNFLRFYGRKGSSI